MKKKLMFLLMLVFLFGCASKQVIESKVKLPMTEQQKRIKWKAIAPFIKEYFKTDMTIREIEEVLVAEEAYQEYLRQKKEKEKKD